MTDPMLTYAVITPARDELANLRRLAESVMAQSRRPDAWVVVDNGSRDGTLSYARELARRQTWITVTESEPTRAAEPGAPIVRAFLAGMACLRRPVDVIVKVDSDVSFDDTHFEKLLDAFAANPKLGIAGSICLEEKNGTWLEVPVSAQHVRGAVRAYRRQCLDDVGPLEAKLGWDTVDELKAALTGWTTGTVDGITFRHHRAVGARDGRRYERARRQGRASHYLGYKAWYLALRSIRRALDDPAALAMLWGYFEAVARREPRHHDKAVIREARRRQTVGQLPARIADARRGWRRDTARAADDS
jgi:glycosyltransferase involved in cell wall biosynthesis